MFGHSFGHVFGYFRSSDGPEASRKSANGKRRSHEPDNQALLNKMMRRGRATHVEGGRGDGRGRSKATRVTTDTKCPRAAARNTTSRPRLRHSRRGARGSAKMALGARTGNGALPTSHSQATPPMQTIHNTLLPVCWCAGVHTHSA